LAKLKCKIEILSTSYPAYSINPERHCPHIQPVCRHMAANVNRSKEGSSKDSPNINNLTNKHHNLMNLYTLTAQINRQTAAAAYPKRSTVFSCNSQLSHAARSQTSSCYHAWQMNLRKRTCYKAYLR